MIRRAFPWLVFGLPGAVVTFVLDVDTLSGVVICVVLGVVAGFWAYIFDGGMPW